MYPALVPARVGGGAPVAWPPSVFSRLARCVFVVPLFLVSAFVFTLLVAIIRLFSVPDPATSSAERSRHQFPPIETGRRENRDSRVSSLLCVYSYSSRLSPLSPLTLSLLVSPLQVQSVRIFYLPPPTLSTVCKCECFFAAIVSLQVF